MADNRKPEHVDGGEPRTFSAIHGKGQAGRAPETKSHGEDKPAIAKIKCNK